MLAKQVVKRLNANIMRITATQSRMFAADDSKGGEWGIKYNDECLKFEKEWKQIADQIES